MWGSGPFGPPGYAYASMCLRNGNAVESTSKFFESFDESVPNLSSEICQKEPTNEMLQN